MTAAVESVHPPLFRRHARRPRLTRLLDESRAQAILITAPAGYGKTTLALEWLQGREDVVWYRATGASADVAAFSAGVADVIEPLVPHAGERLKQRLRVADTPERAARPLAELLAEDLSEWPNGALLVIDDYHLVGDSAPVEDFFDWLLTLAPQLRVLVTSRRRPRWASARRILYGEITEIGRDQLAMSAEEAGRVLEDRPREAVRALVAQAEGWPALIGLAALTASREIPEQRVSEALYRYFAEELIRGEAPEVERFMLLASVPAGVDARIAREVLGVEDPEPTLEWLVAEGMLHPAGDQLRFHPLLRSFLRRKLEAEEPDLHTRLTDAAIADARAGQRWEEAFELAVDAPRGGVGVEIIEQAASKMLASGRIETLERWLNEAGPTTIHHSGATLTRVEVLLRKGQLSDAAAIATELTTQLDRSHPDASRANFLAGQALYLRSGSARAVEYQRRAKELARTSDDLKRALWGLFMTENELGGEAAGRYLDDLEAMATAEDLDTRLRVAVGRQGAGATHGSFAGVWEVCSPLVSLASHARDPMSRTTFFANAAYVCVGRADYRQAVGLATKALKECREVGLDFATGYCLTTLALAHAGLRDFVAAYHALRELKDVSEAQDNIYLRCTFEVASIRVALARGRPDQAVRSHQPDYSDLIPVPATQGEYLGALALAAAATGDAELAKACADTAREITNGIEARFFSAFAELICQPAEPHSEADLGNLIRAANEACFHDAFVLAYRANPRLLELIPPSPSVVAITIATMGRANDHDRARGRFVLPTAVPDIRSALTTREREVLALVSDGLSNAEIAERLVISTSTAKVHVQHILKKLGVKSRLHAAIQAREDLDSGLY